MKICEIKIKKTYLFCPKVVDLLQFSIILTQIELNLFLDIFYTRIEDFHLFNTRKPHFDTTTIFEKSFDATRVLTVVFLHILRLVNTVIRLSTILLVMLFLVILKLQVGELSSILTACHSMTFESQCQYKTLNIVVDLPDPPMSAMGTVSLVCFIKAFVAVEGHAVGASSSGQRDYISAHIAGALRHNLGHRTSFSHAIFA